MILTFFFIAHNQDAILQTIISRCQVTRIPLFDHEEISETLKKQFELSNEEIDQITTLSNGNINTALAMAKTSLKIILRY